MNNYMLTEIGVVNTQQENSIRTAIEALEMMLEPESLLARTNDISGEYTLSVKHHRNATKILNEINTLQSILDEQFMSFSIFPTLT